MPASASSTGRVICVSISPGAAPKVTQVLLNTAFNMFPDSSAAQGKKDAEPLGDLGVRRRGR